MSPPIHSDAQSAWPFAPFPQLHCCRDGQAETFPSGRHCNTVAGESVAKTWLVLQTCNCCNSLVQPVS